MHTLRTNFLHPLLLLTVLMYIDNSTITSSQRCRYRADGGRCTPHF